MAEWSVRALTVGLILGGVGAILHNYFGWPSERAVLSALAVYAILTSVVLFAIERQIQRRKS